MGKRGGKGKNSRDKGKGAGNAASAREAALKQFDTHFRAAYGERWTRLQPALSTPVEHVAWLNPFSSAGATESASFDLAHWTVYHANPGCTLLGRRTEPPLDENVEMPVPVQVRALPCTAAETSASQDLASHYVLDGASPLPAIALAPRPGHRVLDLCAAPGGKTLCLAGQMFHGIAERVQQEDEVGREGGNAPEAARQTPTQRVARAETMLFSNDVSGPRRARLRRVIDEYVPHLPESIGTITVTGMDASSWGRGSGAPTWSYLGFDRILVDAPCSSERHFLHGAADSMWSPARLKRDAELQGSILRNAVRLLAVGGRLVYATCSLAEEENDEVVKKLLAHRRHGAGLALASPLTNLEGSTLKPLLKGVTRTKYGALMLPDESLFGPLYWAVIERRAPPGAGSGGGAEDGEEPPGEPEPQAECGGSKDCGNDTTAKTTRVLDCI